MKKFILIGVPVLLVAFGLFVLISSNGGPAGPSGPNPVVVMETTMGTVKMELYASKAPITVDNFLKYVDAKHYDNTIFHRVIPNFMVQCGGFEPGMKEKSDKFEPIKNESYNGLTNDKGTLAMARTNKPHSATAQFFINVKDNPFLNRSEAQDGFGYAVFGQVIEGMGVVEKIRYVKTTDIGGHENVPVEDVIIKSIRRVEPDQKAGGK
jgi:cyclophilin family peptidyl-prolyl cis-trans isomerase